MIKKLGLVTVGVTATLMAAAPLASASECHDDGGHSDHHESSSEDTGGCSFVAGNGGDAGSGDASGALAATGGNLGGIGGSNILNIGDCSSFLNGNGNGNHVLSDNSL